MELSLADVAELAAEQLNQVRPKDDASGMHIAAALQLLVVIGTDDKTAAEKAFAEAAANAKLAEQMRELDA